MTYIHESNFTGTDGDDGISLTPTTGTALTRVNGAKLMLVKDNRLYASTDYAYYSVPDVPPAYPYTLSCRVRQVDNAVDDALGIMARGSGGQSVSWVLRNGYAGLYINGTLYDRYFFTFADGTDVDLELIVNSATSVTARSHGVDRFVAVAVTLNTIVAPRIHHDPSGATATSGKHMDWWITDDMGSGGGGGGAEPRGMFIAGAAERLADDEREDALRRMLGTFVSTGVLSYQEEAKPRTRVFGYAVRQQQEIEDAERRALGTLRLRTAPKPQYIPPGNGKIQFFFRKKRNR